MKNNTRGEKIKTPSLTTLSASLERFDSKNRYEYLKNEIGRIYR